MTHGASKERELMLTGAGGQGVQLAAQTLARAATLEGRHVMLLGTYGGTMRGGNTESAIVFGAGPLSSPPIVSRLWSAVALHHLFWQPVRAKLPAGALLLVNSTLFEEALEPGHYRLFEVPATQIADEHGSKAGASMVAIGGYAKLTGIVAIESLIEAMRSSLPAYRQQHAEVNEALLRVGFAHFDAVEVPAWEVLEGAA
ncbi:MAG: 2-oxoacid:acceptor oxidoreductase family protein [Deltaproteobacteria bacterium]|nr:2-oxoacid:acceptor oxidoreductase family protein [Deltaproteobacteria bacterium]MBW2418860.1 2-oxoacid:acceptor oxidoreductase family protein [Deltaproteobacteria bacterium]